MAEESKSSPQDGLRWDCTKCTLTNTPELDDPDASTSYAAFLRMSQHKRLIVKAAVGPLVACSACENFRLWRCAVPGCGATNDVAREDSAGDVCLNMVCQSCSAFRLVEWVCQTCSADNSTDMPKPRTQRARHVAFVPRKRNGVCVRCDAQGSFFALFDLVRGGLQSAQRWDDTPRGAGVGVGASTAAGAGAGSSRPSSAAGMSRSGSRAVLPVPVDVGSGTNGTSSGFAERSSVHATSSPTAGGARGGAASPRAASPTLLAGRTTAALSPPFSHRRPCSQLAHELTQDRLTRRAIALTHEFKEWRSIRADGNSLYRAFLIAVLETMLQTAALSRLASFVEVITNVAMGSERMLLDVVLGIMSRVGAGVAGPEAAKELLSYFEAFPGFSDAGVAVLRKVAAAFVLEHPAVQLDGKPYSAHMKNLTWYCRSVVVPMGQEGDHLTVDALCKAFNVRMSVVMLGSAGPADAPAQRLTYLPTLEGAADSGAGTAFDLDSIPQVHLVRVSESFDILYED